MKKMYKLSVMALLLSLSSLGVADTVPKKVAILIPVDVPAMQEITEGFELALQKQYAGPIAFKVAHTQGDINVQHATLQSLQDQHYDLIAPIGSNATAMAMSVVKSIPIVSLASDVNEAQRQQGGHCHVAVVHDEIASSQQLAFIQQAFPSVKKIALIYSASDQMYPEVKQASQAAAALGLALKPMLANSLMDLQTVANNLPDNNQAIFILKDMPIVSGMAQLAHIAQQQHQLLISSDDGSVKNGAAFAVGIQEHQIGVSGGNLAAAILNGAPACSLPIAQVKDLTVFINAKAMQSMGFSIAPLQAAAARLHYRVQMV